MIKNSILTLILFLSVWSFGQEMNVKGTVYDTTGTKTLSKAMVMAVRMKDSLLLGFTHTDNKGFFELKGFEADTFSLIIDHPSADEKIYYMFGHSENFEISIPSIVMPAIAQEIEEVIIYAYKDPIYYKGDTLVYIADSFKVAENAVVEDLLKKLPGITVDKDGKIKSQGQDINKVLVDGDEFFGSDPTIATKNLGADGIATVEIYEKDNDDGIGGDGEKIKVLDLKLKDSAKKGYFGRISGASDLALTPIDGEVGTNPFYEGELLLNKFDGPKKISVFALGSNTPRSSFGWGDMNKFGLENEQSSGNRWDAGAQNNSSGIPQTLKTGVYYSDKFGKKKNGRISVNYSYYNDRLDARSASQSQYFLQDTTYITDDSTRNYTLNESHRINLDFSAPLDSMTTFQIKPSVTFDKGTTDNSDLSNFFTSDLTQTLGTEVFNKNESTGFTVGGFARINRTFKKKNRELELRYDLSKNQNETEGYLNSLSRYYNSVIPNDTANQQKLNNNSSTSHYGTITYVEPLSKKVKLELEYLYESGKSNQEKVAIDYNGVSKSYRDTNNTFSNIFDNSRQQNRGGAKFIYEPKKHYFAIGGQLRNIDISNVNVVMDTTINQNFTNFLPALEYRFKPSMSKRFTFNYRTYSQQPSISDLQPVPDNTNPNQIRKGNANLKPNYVHSINTMFNTWKALTGRYVWAGGNFSYTNDGFADSTGFDAFGRRESQTVNVDGNMSGVLYSGAGLPIFGRKIEFMPGFNASFFRFTNLINDLKNVTDNYAVTPSLKVRFNLLGDSLEIETSGSYSFNNAISTLNKAGNPYAIQNYDLSFKWRLPMGFAIGSSGKYTKNTQKGGGFYNTDFFVLNAELSKKFLKTQNLEIALIGNDILNQNINARREINGNTFTDYRTTIISRYFLLKATLRFNNRKAKEEDFNGMH